MDKIYWPGENEMCQLWKVHETTRLYDDPIMTTFESLLVNALVRPPLSFIGYI